MGVFYHFSHFLEILTGIYFGGFALLSFIEKGADLSFYAKFNRRQKEATVANITANEFFKTNLKTPKETGLLFPIIALLWFVYWVIDIICWLYFTFAHINVRKVAIHKDSQVLQKKFFPCFFFTGCFCLMMILISAMQVEKCNSLDCYNASNFFMIGYLICAVVFQIWSLFLFPMFVNKFDYIHLILLNFLICIVLFILSVKFSHHHFFASKVDWLLNENRTMLLIAVGIGTVIFPLVFILFSIGVVIVSWEIPIFFNKFILRMFNKKIVIDEINEFKDNKTDE